MDELKKWVMAGLLMGVLAVLIIYFSQPHSSPDPAVKEDGFEWHTSLDKALEKASVTGKDVLVIFSASWCPACRQMEEDTLQNDEVMKRISENYIGVRIDVDSNPELSSEYRIYGVPTIIILDSSGNQIRRSEGYMSPQEFMSFL